MIEITFSESACISLKFAQNYGKGKWRGEKGLTFFVLSPDGRGSAKKVSRGMRRKIEKENSLKWENANPMGGNPDDIYGFDLILSIGDISESCPGNKRRQVFDYLYSCYPADYYNGRQSVSEILEKANVDLKAIRERTVSGESVRIWYSAQPDEMCGLYWFLEQLCQWGAPNGHVSIIKLPEWETMGNRTVTQKSCWGETREDEWHQYLALEKPMPAVLMKNLASHWHTLQSENAPLRVALNGRLVSAPENIYDDVILKEMATESETFNEARFIGRILTHQLGINDSLIALRIEKMISSGMLSVVSEADEDNPFFHRILKKSNRINNLNG